MSWAKLRFNRFAAKAQAAIADKVNLLANAMNGMTKDTFVSTSVIERAAAAVANEAKNALKAADRQEKAAEAAQQAAINKAEAAKQPAAVEKRKTDELLKGVVGNITEPVTFCLHLSLTIFCAPARSRAFNFFLFL